MTRKAVLLNVFIIVAMLLATLPVAAFPVGTEKPQGEPPQRGETPQTFTGVAPAEQIASLSGSNVTFDPSVGGDTQFIPGAPGTFCFQAHSYTTDWEYVYNVWLRFPTDWTVNNVYVQGTPACTGGGSWGTFSWSFQTAPYEVNISHPRYQAATDDCVAYYCFDVTAGTGTPDALESWFWDGDGWGSAPHWPCSSDGYAPSGFTCDQAVNPQASIPGAPAVPGVYLFPETQTGGGCNGTPATYNLTLLNQTGSDGTFDLSYDVPSLNGALTGPAQLTVADGATQVFQAVLTPDLCAIPGDVVIGTIEAAGNGYTDAAEIDHTVNSLPGWQAVSASAPSWAGGGYPRDGCTALNASGQWVTYEFGDTTSFYGFWGYNHATNTWFQPNPTGTPADRWAPDWAYDPETNLCYVTGGATAPGGGNLNDAYVYDPVANAFTQLGNFASVRDFHNSWVGTIDGVKYLCIGGGVDYNSTLVQSTQCYDLSQAAPGVWNAENAQMGAFPTDPFGAADGVLHAPGGDQFWYVGGAINAGGSVTDEARYWDDADNAWHFAGNTGVPRYRVEGDFLDGDFYQVGGSSGGFTHTPDAVVGHYDGANWVWTVLPDANNSRMDNIANAAGGTFWSIDGYGDGTAAYVEYLQFCPECNLQGTLEGTVYDYDMAGAPCTGAVVHIEPGGLTVPVDGMGHYSVGLVPGTYQVTANALGYPLPDGPYTVDIVDQMTTTQDFALARPDVAIDPTAFEFYAPVGAPTTVTLDIYNYGSYDLLYEIYEMFTPPAASLSKPAPSAATGDKVEAGLAETLAQGPADLIVWMAEQADVSAAAKLGTKLEKGRYVYETLRATAERTQKSLLAYLDGQGVKYTSFYIVNAVAVRNGNLALLNNLAARPDVGKITANHKYQLQEPFKRPVPEGPRPEAIESNITFINADDVWNMGITGQGTVMAGNDTGLQWDHPALINHYRGWDGAVANHNYNWWDATGTYPTVPGDGHGHGTHTGGTMVGDDGGANQIGVAPGAQIIHCKNMTDGGSGSDTTFLTCFQWDLAPWDLSGNNPMPSLAPDAVNNSWGYWGGGDNQFRTAVNNLQAAGILVEVSAGNEGPSCTTLRSPGDYQEVLTTGSVNHAGGVLPGTITGFSSRGPSSLDGNYFPDIMAPGENIRSSVPGSAYQGGWSGTSMAGPHATALVGLIWSAAPFLRGQVAETMDIIRQTAVPLTGQTGNNCGGDYTTGPNNDWGVGTIDALAAVNLARSMADVPWLEVNPTAGAVPPADVAAIDVTVTCTQTGDLSASILVRHNDPCQADIQVPVLVHCTTGCIPADITNVTSNSPVELGNPMDFAATVMGTTPITMTWDYGDGVVESGVGMYTATHTYAAAGVYTVTVTAENECGVDTFSLAVEVQAPCVPVSSVAIDGPLMAAPGTYTFTASYSPTNATPPVMHLWDDGGMLDYSVRTFAVTGTYTLWVEVSNCGGAAVVTDDHTIEITVADFVVDAPAYTESVYAIAVVPIQITNMGSSTETYDLAFSGNNWDAFLSAVSVTLAAGESVVVELTVEFPSDAGPYATDTLDLSVTPQGGGAPFNAALTVDTACRFDFNGSTLMDMTDVVIMLIEWGGANPFFDINHSGGVDLADLVIALDRFGQHCP